MKSVTRDLPCTPVIDGVPTYFEFTGHDVGALFVHRRLRDREANRLGPWTITHIATGYSVTRGRNFATKSIAMAKAKKLNALNCWDFSEPHGAVAMPEKLKDAIHSILGEP